ncbi:MAG TPA: phosphoribosyltransferase, partial [Thermoprotei archaeon]|nr:phosphoribosyltransferase [Thermoprotei archaeon]
MGVLVENKLWRNKLFVFRDRFDAGITLASFLLKHNVDYDLVIAIPAGGVPVGIEIARLKRCKLYLAITRKI